MASTTRRILLRVGKYPPRIQSNQIATRTSIQWQRPLSSTAPQYDDKKPKIITKDPILTTAEPASKNADVSASMAPEVIASTTTDMGVEQVRRVPGGSKAEQSKVERSPRAPKKREPGPTPEEIRDMQLSKVMADLEALDPSVILDAQRQGKRGLPYADDVELHSDEHFDIAEETRFKAGFWAEGEESLGPDEDYYGDDITSHGHGELEQHRELREYARLIAWELPLLNQLARPFELPNASTPFRFRYTSYLGESHPATNKVVVEFSVSDMPNLTQLQKDKLIKLAGTRYNPDTEIIKMSCEMFDTQAQNKRFLGDNISKLLAEAKDGQDTFADVPFDFRHHKPKKRYEFPKEWILTPKRKQYLEDKRAEQLKLESEKTNNGKLVDGQKIIENTLPFTMPTPEPVMVGGARGKQLR